MKFSEFLSKYSPLNNEFLEDFKNTFGMYDESTNEFSIDVRVLAKFLEIKSKKDFYSDIRCSYVKDVDYSSKQVSKGIYEMKVTLDCAKMICQMSKSSKGKEVRLYFLSIEKLLFRYQNYIIEGLKEKTKQLELNQKPQIHPTKHIIYVFKALNTDDQGPSLYKIGKTVSGKTRFNSYNSGTANDIEILFQYEVSNVSQVESCVKALLKPAKYRKYKEVYECDLNIIKKAISDCECIITNYSKKLNTINKMIKNGNVDSKLYMLIPQTEALPKKL